MEHIWKTKTFYALKKYSYYLPTSNYKKYLPSISLAPPLYVRIEIHVDLSAKSTHSSFFDFYTIFCEQNQICKQNK